MNKATIISDAITYIEELQKNVKDLSDQLMQMEATCVKEEKKQFEENDNKSEMENFGIRVWFSHNFFRITPAFWSVCELLPDFLLKSP